MKRARVAHIAVSVYSLECIPIISSMNSSAYGGQLVWRFFLQYKHLAHLSTDREIGLHNIPVADSFHTWHLSCMGEGGFGLWPGYECIASPKFLQKFSVFEVGRHVSGCTILGVLLIFAPTVRYFLRK